MENDSLATANDTVAAKGGARQMGPMAENTTGDSTTTPTAPTDGENGQMGQPPEMNCDPTSEECEMPEGFDGEMPTDMQGGGFGGRGEMMMQNAGGSTSEAILHPAAYLSIGAGGVVLGLLISYMCFSKFFHLKPGQAFSKLSKFIWFMVVALVITVGICLLGYFIPVWVKG